MTFSELGLNPSILQAVEEAGFRLPTRIQAEAIPAILAGRDVLGCARTGTGKTAAFALPLIQNLEEAWNAVRIHRVRALILSPTRELAIQLFENIRRFSAHTQLTSLLVHGGVGFDKQVATLDETGVDILVATPGRMLDLMDRRMLKLDQVEIFVVDEADRMLDMGFAPDIKKMAELLPKQRQSLFFSATMPKEAHRLAASFLIKPQQISADPVSSAAENIEKLLYYVEKNRKLDLLLWTLQRLDFQRVLIFCRTRRGADRLAERVQQAEVAAEVLHGEKPQKQREQLMDQFKRGEIRMLIATDLAARGIDVQDISHIINFDLPNEPETFVHRIGRTARAGASGQALSFCDPTEKNYLREIVHHLGEEFIEVKEHPFHSEQVKHFSGRVAPKDPSKKPKTTRRAKKGVDDNKRWQLTSGEQSKLHDQQGNPGKNVRNNPKKKQR
jgi:ATP-dependent RNA helicase RhlE